MKGSDRCLINTKLIRIQHSVDKKRQKSGVVEKLNLSR